MANNYFQFKQFTVHQQHCAMKVCTDACLFGAVIPPNPLPFNSAQDEGKNSVLDIGTGTGLLSLMYAQKDPHAIIDAVEIDKAAAQQAKENFEASPWKNRLNTINADILELDPYKKYDLIFSNPPFFENDLRSASAAKNNAKHDTSLHLPALLNAIGMHLNTDGIFAVLLPAHRVDHFEKLAGEKNFHLNQKIMVSQSPKHDHFRGILFFSGEEKKVELAEMTIRNNNGDYSYEFTTLLKDYYLNI